MGGREAIGGMGTRRSDETRYHNHRLYSGTGVEITLSASYVSRDTSGQSCCVRRPAECHRRAPLAAPCTRLGTLNPSRSSLLHMQSYGSALGNSSRLRLCCRPRLSGRTHRGPTVDSSVASCITSRHHASSEAHLSRLSSCSGWPFMVLRQFSAACVGFGASRRRPQ